MTGELFAKRDWTGVCWENEDQEHGHCFTVGDRHFSAKVGRGIIEILSRVGCEVLSKQINKLQDVEGFGDQRMVQEIC